VAGLFVVGAVVWLIKAHVPEAEKERAEASIYDLIGRVLLSLLFGMLGGFCGGVAWGILARNFALVESVGGPSAPGVAAMTMGQSPPLLRSRPTIGGRDPNPMPQRRREAARSLTARSVQPYRSQGAGLDPTGATTMRPLAAERWRARDFCVMFALVALAPCSYIVPNTEQPRVLGDHPS
jgi:hypothetical protein